MHFDVTILGSGSSMPSLSRGSAAQLVNVRENFFMIDCGEGTQIQLRKFSVKIQRLNHIFISHLHGDHYLGLIGLISSLHLLGRTNELNIYAHEDLRSIIDQHLKVSQTYLKYKLNFHPLKYEGKNLLFENKAVSVYSFPLKHRIPCCGFLFREKDKKLPLNKEKIKEYNIPLHYMNRLKDGEDYQSEEGFVIPNYVLTLERPKSYSYAYCSDTIYNESLVEHIQGTDVIYHESTFLNDLKDRAKETFHSTAGQAATIARMAGVNRLILGHFSVRYRNVNDFQTEAMQIFPSTEIAEDGKVFRLY